MNRLPTVCSVLVAIAFGAASISTGPMAAAETLPGAKADPAPTAAKTLPAVVGARVVGDQQRARFVADLTAPVGVAVFLLPDPYRIIVDLQEVRFTLPEDAGQGGKGLVSAFRYGLISRGKSRIVLDVTAPVRVHKTFIVPAAKGQPARLVIDFVATTREAFLQASRAYRETQSLEAAAERERSLTARTPKAPGGRPVVVLDPGHGGIDMGTRGKQGGIEKEITLAFAKILGEKLEKTGLYQVLYTRTDDRFVALGARVAFARSHHANLFVSIHANSFSGGSIRGAQVYTISDEASDQLAGEEAARENQSDVLAGLDIDAEDSDEVKDILLDLTRRETRNFGVVFARNLVKEMRASSRMFKVPHQTASFKVLEAPEVPSAMIELGFITNRDDEKLLLSTEWREKAAGSVVKGIAGYFETRLAEKSGQ
jgi:N-acetylmuramoyl-L-alanine amidase